MQEMTWSVAVALIAGLAVLMAVVWAGFVDH